MKPRLLLVEFLNDDPLHQHRIRRFPYFQGFARRNGFETRWVSIAAGREARPVHPWEVELPSDRLQLLVGAITDFGPTVLVTNERLGASTSAALAAACPDIRRTTPPGTLYEDTTIWSVSVLLGLEEDRETRPEVAGSGVAGGGLWRRLVAWVGRWGASGEAGGSPWALLEDEEPDYASCRLDPGNPTADHFVPIFINPACLYTRSIERNPVFEGMSGEFAGWKGGCTFCQRHGGVEGAVLDREVAVAHVVGQLRRYHETTSSESRRSRFLMFVAPMLRWIGDVFSEMLALGIPPVDLFFSCRVDEFLTAEPSVRQWLPQLAEAGHRLHFWQIGLENFSPDENLRFNKGVSPQQIEQATVALTELEESWPQTFYFQRHGGYGMIVFTPWTRLADLRINASEIRRLGLREQYTMLTSVLLLREGTPLECLARADGLLLEADEPPSPFDAICITAWGEDALRWRFRHREVAAVHEALAALFPGRGAVVGNAVEATLKRLRDRFPDVELEEAEALARLVDAAEAMADASPSDLLERLWETLVSSGGPGTDARSSASDHEPVETRPDEPTAAPTPSEVPSSDGLPRWMARARALFEGDGDRPPFDLQGAVVEELAEWLTDGEPPVLAIRLRRNGETLGLCISAAADGGPAYCTAGRAAIAYLDETPLDSDNRQALLALVAEALESHSTDVFSA